MSSIQTSVGLISGIPIEDTVDQLISVAKQPLNRLTSRTEGLLAERTAVDTLATLVLGLKSSLNTLKSSSTFTKKTATSSDPALLTATVATGASPKVGAYKFAPIQTASSHSLLSGSFSDLTGGLGDGSLSFRFGGHVNKGISLSEINAGAGFKAGKIEITDRSGASAVIDLRAAQTVDDVLEAINLNSEISVQAGVEGNRLTLTDSSGSTANNLVVREVGLGSTAASLGLSGVNVAAETANGAEIFRLHGATRLSTLNDGAGVQIDDDLAVLGDLAITLQDATTAEVDLSGAKTLQDVIDKINEHEDLAGKVAVSVAADGVRLEIADLTSGAANFAIENGVLGTAADDLGLSEASAGGVITGRRLTSGLRDTLVSSLNGGRGYELGEIDITDRDGVQATVNLAGAETLSDIVDLINASAADVTASINSARSGVQIVDNTGGGGNLIVANGATGATADDLGLAVDDAVNSVNSGTLNRQTISKSTLLSSLNGGAGVTLGDVRLTDSNGVQRVIDLNSVGAEAETVGDVIDAINALTNGVEARINDAGDGVLITDTAGGAGKLKVADVNGKVAADLGLLGTSTETDEEGQQVIDGSSTYSVDLSDLDAQTDSIPLSSLNDGKGVSPGIFQVLASNDSDDSKNRFAVDLSNTATLGDVVDEINTAAAKAGVAVTAKLTETGGGIQLVDAAGGAGTLTVVDLGSGSAAADLGIAGEAGPANSSGEQTITKYGLFDAGAAEASALEQVADRINDFGAGVTASVVFDGFGYRLAIDADKTGADNELLIDDSAGLFSFDEISRPKNAVLLFGASSSSAGVAVSSPTNKFTEVVDGLNLTAVSTSADPVTVTVAKDNAPITTAVQNLVKAYNSVRTNLDTVTNFDPETNSTGILFGRNEALRVDTTLSRIASGSFAVGGEFTSLESIGVSLDDKGKLSVDTAKLTAALEQNAGDVERLLADETSGVLGKFNAAIDQLASNETSLLSSRSQALQDTIDSNNQRLESMSVSLDRQRERLLLEFYTLEESLAGFQSNIDLLDSIQLISAPSSSK